jgi:hypothetical protein
MISGDLVGAVQDDLPKTGFSDVFPVIQLSEAAPIQNHPLSPCVQWLGMSAVIS